MFSVRATILVLLSLGVRCVIADSDPTAYLKALDFPAPFCEGNVALDVAPEYFVEIANQLPGREAYNEMVKSYRAKDWPQFEAKLQAFHTDFPGASLQEAAAFLAVEARFERLGDNDEKAAIAAEKGFRETMLTYPKSTLIPPLLGSIAHHWLRVGKYDKSLALYKEAKEHYDTKDLDCVFEAGQAESVFHLRDWKAADAGFQRVVEKCTNARLRNAARLRLADSHWLQGMPTAAADYEKAMAESPTTLEKFYPFGLYNFGELHFRAERYPQAKYYFSRYLKMAGKEAACVPAALQRMADIALHSGEKWETVAGLYLAVHERAPETDVGHFSQSRALLMGLAGLPEPERKRRITVIDAEIDKIAHEPYRSEAYLEKGLALLDAGVEDAMEYLSRLGARAPVPIDRGVIGDFIRDRYLRLLEKRAKAPEAKSDRASDEALLKAWETGYPRWWKGTGFEPRVKQDFAAFLLHRFDEAVAQNDAEDAVGRLERWVDSIFWPSIGPSPEERSRVAVGLVRLLTTDEANNALGVLLLKHEKTLKLFAKDYPWLWMLLGKRTSNLDLLGTWLAKLTVKPKRGVASVDISLPAELRARAWLEAAQASLMLKHYDEADKLLAKVKDKALRVRVLDTRLTLFKEAKRYPQAFEAAEARFKLAEPKKREKELKSLYGVVWEGKLWKRGSTVWDLARKEGIEGKSAAPYAFLDGRSAYELGHWDKSIESFEKGLKLDPGGENAPEARFLLGKSLLKRKRRAQAEQVWNDLVKLKDPFWSPLAQNELKLLP